MTQATVHLVGRASALGVLDQTLAELDQGRSAMLEVVGEPGIGKSRLLEELAGRGEERGYIVLSGRASELERDLPFWVFVDALDEYLRAHETGLLDTLDEGGRAELALIFPSLVELSDTGQVALQDERYRAHGAVRQLLEVLAAPKPLVLLLDDVHWADSGSLELLGALLRTPPSGPVLLAVAMRPRQLTQRFAAALDRALRSGALTQVKLEALSRDEAVALIGERVDRDMAEQLYVDSGGNPFYLEELARAIERARDPSRGAAGSSQQEGEVPSSVAAALSEEFALLSPDARRVLQGAAVAGDPFEPELAAAAASMSEPDVIEALDELLQLDLVRTTDVPRRFRFRHPLVRHSVYEATPGGWRLAAHERTSAELTRRGAPAVARAHHVELAGRSGDAGAVDVLRQAGESVAERTPAGAARWFGAALRLLPDDTPAAERADLLTALAGAQTATGRFAEAHRALLESLQLLSDDDPGPSVQLVAACAALDQLLGRHDAAYTRLERALADLPDEESADGVTLLINLALESFYRRAYDASLGWSLRALDIAMRLGDETLIAAGAAARALAGACVGDVHDAERDADRAASLVDSMTDLKLASRIDAIVHLCAAETYLDRYGDAITHAERGLSIARSTGQGQLLPMLIPVLGTALAMRGRLAEAAEILDGAVEGARVAANDQTLAWQLLNRAYVAAVAGDAASALALGEESAELAQALGSSVVSTYVGVVLASVHMERGDSARAVEVFVAAAGGEDLPLYPGGDRALFLEMLARCLLDLGRLEDAGRAAAAAEAVAQSMPRRLVGAWADRASAAVALANGDASTAARRALDSAAAADTVGAPIHAALARTLAGRALAEVGERARAVEELERAAAELDACGAVRYRDAAEKELRRLGRRVRRTPVGGTAGDGVDSLTERERQVAELVVDRKTNPEIAAELFLSLKTVETHMRHIFGKLGVSSRVEVARVLEADARARRVAGPAS